MENTKTCGNCFYWCRQDNKAYGECCCMKLLFENETNEAPIDGISHFLITSCYGIGLNVGEQFGCVHFKADNMGKQRGGNALVHKELCGEPLTSEDNFKQVRILPCPQ